jgi:hypothetical protein
VLAGEFNNTYKCTNGDTNVSLEGSYSDDTPTNITAILKCYMVNLALKHN